MTMQIAIIGLGAAGREIHVPACRAIPSLHIAGAVDPRASTGRWPFPVFHDVESMFRAISPTVAVIATPTDSHHALCIEFLRRGCHVFCEKPFTENLAQAHDIVDTAERLGLSVIVNNEFRFMRCHLAAKNKIGQPDFGDVGFIDICQTFFTTPETEKGWRGSDPQRTCKEFGTHVFDLCRFFYDDEPVAINARMPAPGRKSGPDYLNLIDLEFTDGRYARITLDRLSRGRHRYLDIRLDGTHACIETSLGGNMACKIGINARTKRPYVGLDISWGSSAYLWRHEHGRKIASDSRKLFSGATTALLQAWLRALAEGREPTCSGRDNIATLATMLAAYESARLYAPVNIKKFMNASRSGIAESQRPTTAK